MLCSLFSSGYEVVNADSVQVYRQLDIGSAKASEEEQKLIKHHLIDILDPWENYNVADFIRLADDACGQIRKRGNVPVLSGGTAFYFKNFLYGLSQAPMADENTRKEVSLYLEQVGNFKAHEYLQAIDPVSAQRINPNDSYRISRAIEVFRTSGKPLSSFAVPTKIRNNMEVVIIGLKRDKEELHNRIEKRVDIMFEQGIVSEIKHLIDSGANSSWQSMQGIGYSEFIKAYEKTGDFDCLDLSEIRNQIIMDSIHYAKRQMTFFNSFASVNWFNPEDVKGIKELLDTTFCSNPQSR